MDDVLLLSRIQFALTIMFHYLFPPLTIGMGVVLVYLEGQYLRTGDTLYEKAAKFWTKIFALNFAIGVASGIVMEFEFGTNWAFYSNFVGDVFGSALAAEGIFAFFLESGFLAVLVFGWDRVGPKMHFFATLMVALGSIFSAVWIVVANSWQQTPAGFHVVQMMKDGQPWFVDGQPMLRAEITDFWQLVFNPSTVHRLTHVLIGAFIMGAFFIMSISAWYILKKRHIEFAKRSFTGALILATVGSLAALVSGHIQANNVYETQPAKMAAFEGHYTTGPGDLSLFGIPNDEEKKIDFNIAVPGGLSFLLHEDFQAEVVGLDKFKPDEQPPTLIPFATYHAMIGLGMFFIVLTLTGCYYLWRGTLFNKRWLMGVFVVAVLGAVIANQAGWIAAEVGRQPWIVHPKVEWNEQGELVTNEAGLVDYPTVQVTLPDGTAYTTVEGLRTDEGVSKAISAQQVLRSIIMFSLIYLLLGAVWLFVLNDKIQKGPEPPDGEGASAPKPPHDGLMSAATSRMSHEEHMTGPDNRSDRQGGDA